MCCLNYEQAAYEDLHRTSPKLDSLVDTVDGRGTVVELDLLRQRVKVRMEERPEVVGTYQNADIAILRNGKAKKTDPPIPADLAPISGKKRAVKKAAAPQEDGRMFLDPIKFRYSTEIIAEEQEIKPEQPQAAAEEQKSRRNRRRHPRYRKAKQNTPKE
jgi:hypothetical protein